MQDLGQAAGARKPWKQAADGRTVFRLVPPIIMWWVWVVIAIATVAQVVIPEHDYFSIEVAAGLAAVTAIAYATAVRPRVIADDDRICVCNPFRDHRIGWGGVNGVYLGDSVELSCARPAPRKDKTIHCWALYSGRRSRLRARLRAERNQTAGFGRGLGVSGRAPAEARELARQDTVQLMAADIGRRSAEAREHGAPAGVLESAWAWWPIACVLVPAAVLLGLLLAGG